MKKRIAVTLAAIAASRSCRNNDAPNAAANATGLRRGRGADTAVDWRRARSYLSIRCASTDTTRACLFPNEADWIGTHFKWRAAESE